MNLNQSRLRLQRATHEREEKVGYLRSECLLVHDQFLHTFPALSLLSLCFRLILFLLT